MKSNYQNIIISKIKKQRELHNYSQSNIAALIGISPGQVGNIESYKTCHKYTLQQISLLCDEFKISIDTIFLENIKKEETKEEFIKRLINSIIEYEKQQTKIN